MQLDELGLYDIYGIQNVPFWQTTWFMVLVINIIVLLIGGSAYGIYRWHFAKKNIRSAYEQALFDFVQLKKNQLVGAENAKAFYYHATMIIKQYLFDEWEYDCLSYTDHELIDFLQISDDIKLLTPEITRLFRGSQLIKFAGNQVNDEYITQDYQSARTFIKKLHALKQHKES